MEEKQEVKSYMLSIPKELHSQFKIACVANEVTMADAIRGMIESYVQHNIQ